MKFWRHFLEAYRKKWNPRNKLLVSIVLARLLQPQEYGLIALISIFIALANVFIQTGLNTALIQKKDVDEKDYSTVFYASLGVAGFCMLYCFLLLLLLQAL